MKRQGKSRSYVVYVGRRPGIYSTWGECSAQVNGFPGNLHDSFSTREAALTAWNNYWAESEPLPTGTDMAASTEIQQVHCSGVDMTVGKVEELVTQKCLTEEPTDAKGNVPLLATTENSGDKMAEPPFILGVMIGFIIGVLFVGVLVIMFK